MFIYGHCYSLDPAHTFCLHLPQEQLGGEKQLFINVPSISRWEWHPFSLGGALGHSLQLNVKNSGAFTAALMDKLQLGMRPVGALT